MLYCKNEKCKEYRTRIPHNCLNWESNLSRECGFINAPKSGATVVIPPEILDLVRFLAELWYDIEKVKWDALEAVTIDQIKDHLIMKWPIVQGTANQINLGKIASQGHNIKNVGKAVDWMLTKAV